MSMGFNDLLKLAEWDFKTAVDMEKSFPDEYAVRASAYHLQQAVEKILKAAILYNGENPPFTHDIGRLAEHCSKLGISFDDELENIADTLTLWESKCRFFSVFHLILLPHFQGLCGTCFRIIDCILIIV